MKTNLMTALAIAPLFAAATATCAAPGEIGAGEAVRVFVIDDQTGEELQTLHGIQPLKLDDLVDVVNAVLEGDTPVQLVHQAIDEDASDNPLAQMLFQPFRGSQPPKAPQPNMPMRQFAEAVKAYHRDRAIWQREIIGYRQEAMANAEAFVQRVALTQLEVSQRFDRILAARNGRDFNRSDICGSLAWAGRLLGQSGRRILILNTDAKDLPANREPRTAPLTPAELDPGIELIFVNTSHLPEQSPLFSKIPNPRQHANSMREAMGLVIGLIAPRERETRIPSSAAQANRR